MTANKKILALSKKRYIKGAKASEPKTAEEHLEAGVELEEAGEKWRAGDSRKALRFFTKAIDQYDAGFRAFPGSFDLAYNKARLQYDITQQPQLVKQLPNSVFDLLRAAAYSHGLALDLDSTNADVLFNLAQLYSSLAEALLEARGDAESQQKEAWDVLHKAGDLFEQCFKIQEQAFADAKQLTSQILSSPTDDRPWEQCGPEAACEATEEVWASVVEPITEDTLLETCLAHLNCLKTLCELQSPALPNELALMEDVYAGSLIDRIRKYTISTDHKRQAMLGQATFLAAYACARFRLLRTDVPSLENELISSLAALEALPGTACDGEALCVAGDAYLEFNACVEGRLLQSDTDGQAIETVNRLRWTHITKALNCYTMASKVPKVSNLARIHISRGDCELYRAQLGDDPFRYELAEKSQATLVKNAGVYYGAAKKVLSNGMQDAEMLKDKAEADIKSALVAVLAGNSPKILSSILQRNRPEVLYRVEDIVEHGRVGGATWARLSPLLGLS